MATPPDPSAPDQVKSEATPAAKQSVPPSQAAGCDSSNPEGDAWRAYIEACADQALASGQVVVAGYQFAVVPDTVALQAIANGEDPAELEQTWRLLRPDGRVAYLFALPPEWRAA